jgi:Domain of unknown function (DUF6429)
MPQRMVQQSEQLVVDLSLMLMYLSSWNDRSSNARRFWKGFDFDVLNTLEEQQLIEQSRTAKSAYLTEAGERRARELLDQLQPKPSQAAAAQSTVVRLYAGDDGQSHFEPREPSYRSGGDQSESAELVPDSGILVRRFEAGRNNPWHHAPGRYAVFTLCGAVDIEIGDGSVRRIDSTQVLIAEDLSGQGHQTREVGPEARVSVFVPLP